MTQKGRVLGVGGIFFKSADKDGLNNWYEKHLGLKLNDWGGAKFEWLSAEQPDRKHVTAWTLFPRDSKYYEGDFMINYIVDDLDAILARLESEGVKIDPKRESDESIGRFAWIYDSDGNRIELWEPASR